MELRDLIDCFVSRNWTWTQNWSSSSLPQSYTPPLFWLGLQRSKTELDQPHTASPAIQSDLPQHWEPESTGGQLQGFTLDLPSEGWAEHAQWKKFNLNICISENSTVLHIVFYVGSSFMLSFQMSCKSTQKRIFFIKQMELEMNQERCHDV